jgi:hypothetical protein
MQWNEKRMRKGREILRYRAAAHDRLYGRRDSVLGQELCRVEAERIFGAHFTHNFFIFSQFNENVKLPLLCLLLLPSLSIEAPKKREKSQSVI